MRSAIKKYTLLLFAILTASYTHAELIPNRYAKNFQIERYESHTRITVSNLWRGSQDTRFQYVLVPKTSEVPADLPQDALLVRTPVERIVTMATVYLGHIQELGLHDKLVGASYLSHTNDPIVHQRVESGAIQPVQNGSAIDVESLMMLQPDIILTSTTGTPAFDVHPQLIRAKQPVVLTAGYMEDHPLARSEWIKFVAAFAEMDEKAKTVFDKTADRYETLAALTQSVDHRPTLFVNAPYGGNWHQPGGASYSAQAFKDAGADYLWAADTSSGGIPLDFERIYYKAANADYWLNPSGNLSLNQLLQADQRFAKFKAFRENNVFNNTRRTNANGGNDIWERGISHPEEVLADLIKIFHPDLLPHHDFIFYERLD